MGIIRINNFKTFDKKNIFHIIDLIKVLGYRC